MRKLDVPQIKRQSQKSGDLEEMACVKMKVWHNKYLGNCVSTDLNEELDIFS